MYSRACSFTNDQRIIWLESKGNVQIGARRNDDQLPKELVQNVLKGMAAFWIPTECRWIFWLTYEEHFEPGDRFHSRVETRSIDVYGMQTAACGCDSPVIQVFRKVVAADIEVAG